MVLSIILFLVIGRQPQHILKLKTNISRLSISEVKAVTHFY